MEIFLQVMPYVNDANDKLLSVDVAFAEKAMRTREVPGADFRLAKCLTLDFFGAGIVELPPMSIKNSKNTRRMQMVFFIHTGKVHVEVANREFNINKGGIWQVPRGMCIQCFSITCCQHFSANVLFLFKTLFANFACSVVLDAGLSPQGRKTASALSRSRQLA